MILFVNSAALQVLENLGFPSLDFELALTGGSGPGYYSFADMLDGGFSGSGSFSGAMSIPEPVTVGAAGVFALLQAMPPEVVCHARVRAP